MSQVPVQVVIDEALATLSRTITDEWAIAPLVDKPPGARADKIESIEKLQERVTKLQSEVVVQLAGLRHIRNQQDVPLHTLPPEVFIEILSRTFDWPDWTIPKIHTLAKVSKFWFETIVGHSLFWPEIDVNQGIPVTEMVLRRNPTGHLVVRCAMKAEDTEDREKFLAVAEKHSDRWQSLIFKGHITDKIAASLQAAAPELRELFVYQYTKEDTTLKQITLSEGTPLRHLDLDFVAIPWGSQRLSQLQSVQLRNLTDNIPTLEDFHSMLSSSPNLFLLVLSKITLSESEANKYRTSVQNTTPIHLPKLESLVVQNLAPQISSYLLLHMDAPDVGCLDIDDTQPTSYSTDSPSNFINLITPSLKQSKHLDIIYSETSGFLRMVSSPVPEVSNEWVHWVKRTPGFDVIVKTAKKVEAWRDVISFFASTSTSTTDCLILRSDTTEAEATSNPQLLLETTFSLSSLQNLANINRLSIKDRYPATPIIKYLAEPHMDVRGEMVWCCPKMKTLDLSGWQGDTDALAEEIIELGRKRFPPSPPAPPPTDTESEVEEPEAPPISTAGTAAPETPTPTAAEAEASSAAPAAPGVSSTAVENKASIINNEASASSDSLMSDKSDAPPPPVKLERISVPDSIVERLRAERAFDGVEFTTTSTG